MNSLELFFEGWMESIMRQHDRIQAGEEGKLAQLNDQSKTFDQMEKDFERRMEMAALEYERWVTSKSK